MGFLGGCLKKSHAICVIDVVFLQCITIKFIKITISFQQTHKAPFSFIISSTYDNSSVTSASFC